MRRDEFPIVDKVRIQDMEYLLKRFDILARNQEATAEMLLIFVQGQRGDKMAENYGKLNCGVNCRSCEWYGICPHSYAQYEAEWKRREAKKEQKNE